MTPQEFEGFLFRTRAELTDSFQSKNQVTDMDVYAKTILDYQEHIAKKLFDEIYHLHTSLTKTRGDILKDNRERSTDILTALHQLKPKS